jgi:hypothetical protein
MAAALKPQFFFLNVFWLENSIILRYVLFFKELANSWGK